LPKGEFIAWYGKPDQINENNRKYVCEHA